MRIVICWDWPGYYTDVHGWTRFILSDTLVLDDDAIKPAPAMHPIRGFQQERVSPVNAPNAIGAPHVPYHSL